MAVRTFHGASLLETLQDSLVEEEEVECQGFVG